MLLSDRALLGDADPDGRRLLVLICGCPSVVVDGTRGACRGGGRLMDGDVVFGVVVDVWIVDARLLAS